MGFLLGFLGDFGRDWGFGGVLEKWGGGLGDFWGNLGVVRGSGRIFRKTFWGL